VEFDLAVGETKELVVDLSVKAPCKIRVRVTRDGKPVPGVEVVLEVVQGENSVGQQSLGVTGDDGVVAGSSAGGGRVSFTARSAGQLVMGRSAGVAELTAGALFESEVAVRTGDLVIQFPVTLKIPDSGYFMVILTNSVDLRNSHQTIQVATAHSPLRMGKGVWKDLRNELGEVAMGEYDIAVNAQSHSDDMNQVQLIQPFLSKIKIEAGQTTLVEIK